MFMIHFGLTDVSIRRGQLYGDLPCEVVLLRLLFVSVAWVRGPYGAQLIHHAVIGLSRDKDWLIKNSPAIRRARRKAEAKGRAQGRSEWEDDYNRVLADYRQMFARCGKLETENSSLRSSLMALACSKEPSHDNLPNAKG